MDKQLRRIPSSIPTEICIISQKEYLVFKLKELQASRKKHR